MCVKYLMNQEKPIMHEGDGAVSNVSALEFVLLSSHNKICSVQLQFPQALPSKRPFICLKDLILFFYIWESLIQIMHLF